MIFLLFFIVFANARVALRRGKSSWGWGLLTFLGYLVGEAIGVAFMLLITRHKALVTFEDSRAFAELLQRDVLKSITVSMFGLGGGLFVRYLLQRTPAAGSPNSTEG